MPPKKTWLYTLCLLKHIKSTFLFKIFSEDLLVQRASKVDDLLVH